MTMSRALTLVSLLVVTCDSLKIVETAQAATPELTVLVEALIKSQFTTTLGGTGPFTVFAPTNAAFTAALATLKIDKAAFLARKDLGDILAYHMIKGKKIMAADLQASQTPATLRQGSVGSGLKVMVAKSGAAVTFGGAKVTKADVACDNGVIHYIDAVVFPPGLNIVETAQAETPELTILVEALIKSQFTTTLGGTGPFTVFAPTNAAFTAALATLKVDKAAFLARKDLGEILAYHMIKGKKIMAADLQASQTPATLKIGSVGSGENVTVAKSAAGVTFGDTGAKVTSADLACKNGVIHIIDKVVLPLQKKTVKPNAPLANLTLTSLAASKDVAASVAVGVAMMVLA